MASLVTLAGKVRTLSFSLDTRTLTFILVLPNATYPVEIGGPEAERIYAVLSGYWIVHHQAPQIQCSGIFDSQHVLQLVHCAVILG